MFRLRSIPFLLCVFLMVTGCWDSRNIEELNMEVGAALDKAPAKAPEEGYRKKNIFKLTLQFPHKQSGSQSNQSEQQQKQYENRSGIGDSVLEIFREFSLKEDRPSFGAHLKVLIISEELAREINMQIMLSIFTRALEIRDSCILLIAKGAAYKALKISSDFPAFQLIGIHDNQYKTARLLPTITLGQVQNHMAAKNNFIIQSISVKNKKIKFNGGSIIKGGTNKLIGFLNEEEVEGLNWLTGKAKGGFVKGRDPKTNGLITYDISSVKSKIIPHIKAKQISFDVNIESEGRLYEDWILTGNAFSNKFIKRAEIATQKKVKLLIAQTLNKLQKQYQVDAVGFGEQLRIHYPKEWKKIEKDWDKQFSKVPIKYDINITINDYMVKGKKEVEK